MQKEHLKKSTPIHGGKKTSLKTRKRGELPHLGNEYLQKI